MRISISEVAHLDPARLDMGYYMYKYKAICQSYSARCNVRVLPTMGIITIP